MFFLVKISINNLTWVFLNSIRIATSTATVRNIGIVNFRGLDGAFNSLFSVLIVAVFFLLFSGLRNRLKEPRVGRLRILVPRLRA